MWTLRVAVVFLVVVTAPCTSGQIPPPRFQSFSFFEICRLQELRRYGWTWPEDPLVARIRRFPLGWGYGTRDKIDIILGFYRPIVALCSGVLITPTTTADQGSGNGTITEEGSGGGTMGDEPQGSTSSSSLVTTEDDGPPEITTTAEPVTTTSSTE